MGEWLHLPTTGSLRTKAGSVNLPSSIGTPCHKRLNSWRTGQFANSRTGWKSSWPTCLKLQKGSECNLSAITLEDLSGGLCPPFGTGLLGRVGWREGSRVSWVISLRGSRSLPVHPPVLGILTWSSPHPQILLHPSHCEPHQTPQREETQQLCIPGSAGNRKRSQTPVDEGPGSGIESQPATT